LTVFSSIPRISAISGIVRPSIIYISVIITKGLKIFKNLAEILLTIANHKVIITIWLFINR
jgi:hypothetical protein